MLRSPRLTNTSALGGAHRASEAKSSAEKLLGLRSFKRFPFLAIALITYISLRSTAIYGDFYLDLSIGYRNQYFGWYDALLLIGSLIQIFANKGRYIKGYFLPVFGAYSCLLVPAILHPGFEANMLLNASLEFFRFALVLVVVRACCLIDEGRAVREMMFFIAIVLFASAIAVYIVSLGVDNRMYGAALTVASYSQYILVVYAIALIRGRWLFAGILSAILALTFSRTSILTWLLVSMSFTWFSGLKRSHRLVIICACVLGLIGAIVFSAREETQLEFLRNLNSRENISSMNGRLGIWNFGLDALTNGTVPWHGMGPGSGHILLQNARLSEEDPIVFSFHSIWFEHAVDLGIFCLPIFALLISPAVIAYRKKAWESFVIFLIFLLTQSVDFTCYRPKEVILWGLIWGYALSMLARRNGRGASI